MTRHIVQTIDEVLKPKGVAVFIDANHQCMSTRGVQKADSSTVTSMFSGIFKEDMEREGNPFKKKDCLCNWLLIHLASVKKPWFQMQDE